MHIYIIIYIYIPGAREFSTRLFLAIHFSAVPIVSGEMSIVLLEEPLPPVDDQATQGEPEKFLSVGSPDQPDSFPQP